MIGGIDKELSAHEREQRVLQAMCDVQEMMGATTISLHPVHDIHDVALHDIKRILDKLQKAGAIEIVRESLLMKQSTQNDFILKAVGKSLEGYEIKIKDKFKDFSPNSKIKGQRDSETPFMETERNSMLKIILGMAMKGYGFNPEKRTDAVKDIVNDLSKLGIPVGDDTIWRKLDEAKHLLPNESVKGKKPSS